MRQGKDLIHVACSLDARDVGLQPPPSVAHLKVGRLDGRWRVLLWSSAGLDEGLKAWLTDHGEFTPVTLHEGTGPCWILETEVLPNAWAWIEGDVDVRHMRLDADGTVNVWLAGGREAVQEMLDTWNSLGRGIDVESVGPSDTRPLLTDRQHEAVAEAAARGYYAVPREVRLQDLAEVMDLSLGGLSELLRRAEAKLIWEYLSHTPLPGHHIIDEEDPSSDPTPWALSPSPRRP